MVDYEHIDCPDIDRNLLSKDQQYLLDISNAITLGSCPEDLANGDPGPLSHFRWLTADNGVLRVYIRYIQICMKMDHVLRSVHDVVNMKADVKKPIKTKSVARYRQNWLVPRRNSIF